MSFINRIKYVIWYFQRPPWDSGVTPPELLEFLKTHQVGRAIDLGCGTGTNTIKMSQMGWDVTGLDFVPSAIRKARIKSRQAGVDVDLKVGDVTRLEGIDGLFDFALDLGCYHSLSVQEKSDYFQQLERVLRPGAIWFMYGFINHLNIASGIGITMADLDIIEQGFQLLSRIDGLDRDEQVSAYFIFQKHIIGAKNK